MKNENDSHFLFAIVIVLSICLAALAVLCGEEIMKNKIIVFAIICIIIVCSMVFFGFVIFSKKKCDETKSRTVYESLKPKISKDTERLMFINSKIYGNVDKDIYKLKHLKFLDFDVSEWIFVKGAFNCCKNLEEITFFQKPENFNSNEFSKCLNLKKIILVGKKSDWKNFEICVPTDCEIVFEENKTVVVGGTD